MAELPKTYDPREVEPRVRGKWQDAQAFHAPTDVDGESFCIVIPPPNVTAVLHAGHALNNTLQDILVRFHRMRGDNTLWMPGTDHAGIATQTVVEKRLLAEENRRRTDYGREEFVARVQQWKDDYEQRILGQLEAMGCSCDWQRTRFTMDEVCARAVRETFFRLFRQGLIYRGKRLVNWDPATQTVLADDEVEHETVQGHFWYLRYPLSEPVALLSGETIESVVVATTRPETMLGDTAVAMNPADPRAAALIGRTVRLPIVGRTIPIIADEHVVPPDPQSEDEKARFSTGFLKVTPAHDPDDYQIGQRHAEEIAAVVGSGEDFADPTPWVQINVMAPDGSISDRHGWTDWARVANPDAEAMIGLDRYEAREAIVEWFRTEGLLEEVREYAHEVGHSYRSHVAIEPYLSDQWYVAVKRPVESIRPDDPRIVSPQANRPLQTGTDAAGNVVLAGTDVPVNSLAGLALAPLMDERLRFVPERYERNYRQWLENLRDWPISRQLWWGHRIPVWSIELPRPAGDAEDLRALATAALNERFDGDFAAALGSSGRWALHAAESPDRPEAILVHLCPAGDDRALETQLENMGFARDEDVLDTWFSSALWPFSTMGWPARTPEMQTYYPGDVLCTAREIITLWVSRMVMMGQYCAGEIPFRDVFIHAMIQDGQGRKMSKSLGNGIDPLDIIESHGADAMRFTLASMTTQTQDVRMPVEEMTLPDGRRANSSPKFDLGRNFCNKLFNVTRFVLMNLTAVPAWDEIRPREHLADRWILSRLNAAIRDAGRSLEGYRFNELADTLYHFTWDDLCDWYVEIAKDRIRGGEAAPQAILALCLDRVLRLLHPVAPFITEALWERLNEVAPLRGPAAEGPEALLARAAWPRADAAMIDPHAEQQFDRLRELVREVRNVRMQHNVPPSKKVEVLAEAAGPLAEMLRDNRELFCSQAGAAELKISSEAVCAPADAAAIAAGEAKLFVLGILDPAAERQRLQKQHKELTGRIGGAEKKLANENFTAKAPPEVVQRERDRLETLRSELAAVEQSLAALDAAGG